MKANTIYRYGGWMLSMFTTLALAAPPPTLVVTDAPRQKVVSFADLDLTRAEGVSTLYNRIQGAAREVCRPLEDRSLQRAALLRECLSTAVDTAVKDVGSPLLTQHHFAATGRQVTSQATLAMKK